MSAQHTQGRLLTKPVETKDGPSVHIGFSDGFVWESGFIAEDARRLAACWNACEGVATEGIEALAQAGGVAAADAIMKKALAEFQEMKRDIEDEWEAARKLRADLAAARALLSEVLESGTIMETASETADRHEREKRIRAFLKGGA